jgi:hypothetical protein
VRDYSKVGPRFWTGDTGRYLRRLGRDAQVTGFYLFTCPNANMLGLYYLPLPTLSHETGIDVETARVVLEQLAEAPLKPLASPFEGVFARYDEHSETVFVTEMARHQIGEQLTRRDNRHKAVVKELEQFRKSPFFNDFLSRYRADFELQDVPLAKPLASPFGAPSKPEAGAGTESEAGERETRARGKVFGEPQKGVTDFGTALTAGSARMHDATASEWRRSVPDCDPAAFGRWVVHWERIRGKVMGSDQRLGQARELARNGDAAAQTEVVEYCTSQDYKSLIPLADVRAKTRGMSRSAGHGASASKTLSSAERNAADTRWPALMTRATAAGFRKPYDVETADVFETALKIHERDNPRRKASA